MELSNANNQSGTEEGEEEAEFTPVSRNCSYSSPFFVRSLPAKSLHKLGRYTKFQFEFKRQLIILSFFGNKSSQAIGVWSRQSLLLLSSSFSLSQ